jgi:pyruvate-formate lyase-activating enzyme
MQINYAGKVELSTIDWFGHAAYVIFLNGCPMHCPRCHNAQLREAVNMVEFEEVVRELGENKAFLNHVVISGGEPSCQPQACMKIIEYCHDMGMKLAIETSGCCPIVYGGFDAVFLDVKTSLEKGAYDSYTGLEGSFDSLMSNLTRMDTKRSEIRIVLFPDSKFDISTLGVLKGFPIRISIGRGMGDGIVSQEDLVKFGFLVKSGLDYHTVVIEQGRMLIKP